METTTIILLSVLSTLSVVAVITIVAVSFMRLGKRVDGNNDDCHRAIDALTHELYAKINEVTDSFSREYDDIRRTIDSRCDKLDSKIKSGINDTAGTHINASSEKQIKQILQG
jgi:hypothetical protein